MLLAACSSLGEHTGSSVLTSLTLVSRRPAESIIKAVYHHLDLNTSPEQLNQLRRKVHLRVPDTCGSAELQKKTTKKCLFFSADDESPSCMF